MRRKLLAGIGLGLLAAGITLFLSWAQTLEEAELSTYDWRIRMAADPSSVNPDIVLVQVNDTSIRDLAPTVGRWPWPRVVFAALLDYLNEGAPRVVAFDLGFMEPDPSIGVRIGDTVWSGKDSDAAFAEALARSRATVLVADAVYVGVASGEQANRPAEWRHKAMPFRLGDAIGERPTIVPPLQPMTDAATLLGHNWLPFDIDGPMRRMAPFVRQGDRFMPAFGIAAAIVAAGLRPDEITLEGETIRFRDRVMPLVPLRIYDAADPSKYETHLTTLINYRAPPLVGGRRPYQSYEIRHLLASADQLGNGDTPDIPPSTFKDKIVLVGLAASGLTDVFSTPFGSTHGTMPGIQLHATMVDNLLADEFIRPASDTLRRSTVIGAGLIVGSVAAALPFTPAAAATLLAASGWIWYCLFAFKGGVWLNMAQPLLTMATALFAGTTYQYFVEGAEKRLVKALFGRYVSRDVFKQLLTNPELAELGGKRRDMTVLFSDIRGFTSVTEKGEPEALVAQLNEYFSKMVEVVFRHHGTVDKFVGDMVMALFGAPVDDPDHADHAVAAAVDMVAELAALNRKWAVDGKAQLDIGVGVNSGEMIAGNIGSRSIMSYTVIGDNVNLGSRLESLNKDYATRIIISDATRGRLRGLYTLRPLGNVTVKGKSRPVAIFEVVVPAPVAERPEELQS